MISEIIFRGKIEITANTTLENHCDRIQIADIYFYEKCFHCQSLFALLILGFAFSLIFFCYLDT